MLRSCSDSALSRRTDSGSKVRSMRVFALETLSSVVE